MYAGKDIRAVRIVGTMAPEKGGRWKGSQNKPNIQNIGMSRTSIFRNSSIQARRESGGALHDNRINVLVEGLMSSPGYNHHNSMLQDEKQNEKERRKSNLERYGARDMPHIRDEQLLSVHRSMALAEQDEDGGRFRGHAQRTVQEQAFCSASFGAQHRQHNGLRDKLCNRPTKEQGRRHTRGYSEINSKLHPSSYISHRKAIRFVLPVPIIFGMRTDQVLMAAFGSHSGQSLASQFFNHSSEWEEIGVR
ncbi:hypothetical protein K438DRAFT_1778679 [Mycena galopus ATCC 62051]|nr:hypothetical protein K438DRAFT_1778679 [Mycena galopus ATCC 62051]